MKPKVGITTGCLCGIGPEVVSKAISDPRVLQICIPKVFGDLNSGREDCGAKSIKAVESVVHAVMSGEVGAIVTAPINKLHWKKAGSEFLGHTEFLASLGGVKSVCMMMASPKLKVSLVTTHARLADVPHLITKERICEVTKLTLTHLRTYALTHLKKIAICALNPHAGESGEFGDEEEKIILPAIAELKSEGYNVSGPYASDTVFLKALNGEFAAVIAMYHDQALGVIKTLDFRNTVNVTLGLPFIRTSPDHGTAEDIVGKGIADHSNMVEAIKMAVELVRKCLST